MSRLLLDRRESVGAGPGVHALIIGVGTYHHLSDNDFAFDGYTSLKSAPVSALRFLDCLLDTAVANWSQPVASVDVLLSPARTLISPDGESVEIIDPTRQNTQKAFDAWLKRCESHPENIAVLYFCGHGVQAGRQILLSSDFAASRENNPFLTAIDFDTSRDGMLTRLPPTQCVFVDACRVPLTEAIMTVAPTDAPPLVRARSDARMQCRYDLTLRAPFLHEFGAPPDPDGSVSYFTAALVKALEGQAAERDLNTGEWVVSNESVSIAMTRLLQREHAGGTGHAVGGSLPLERTVLRWLAVPPPTDFIVRWEAAIRTGKVKCLPSPPVRSGYEIDASGEQPWEFTAQAGGYLATAECDHGSYVAEDLSFVALPPAVELTVRRKAQ